MFGNGNQFEIEFTQTTLGVQYFFNPRVRLAVNYEIREGDAVNFPASAGPNGNVGGIDDRIAVDIHGDGELTDFDGITLPSKIFSDHHKVFFTPVVSFLDLSGSEVYRQLVMIKTPEEFLLLGAYIEDERFFDTEFDVFYMQRLQKSPGEILTMPHKSSASSGESL